MNLHVLKQTSGILQSSSRQNFARLLMLRTMAIAAWCIAIVVGMVYLDMHLQVMPLAITITIWIVFSLLSWWRNRNIIDVDEHTFLIHLVADIVILSVLLYFTGGPGNPFTMLYLLPLTIAAAVLPSRYTWSLAGLAIAGYSLLLILDAPSGHSHVMGNNNFLVHVLGMWMGFIFAAVLIAYFVGNMGSTIRKHERVLAKTKEQSLRDEHLVSLGTLATGAAHELGTPLGSILIITKELNDEFGDTAPELREQLQVLSGQVERCKKILALLSSSAGQLRAEEGSGLPIDTYLQNVITEWQALRPAVEVRCQLDGVQPPPRIIGEKTLSQAIINILNNAADASAEPVEVDAKWTEQNISIEVRDRGSSLTQNISDKAGKSFFSSKADGLGMGLFLAHSTIDRLGGSVALNAREGGGACTRIELPLLKLLIANESEN